MIELIRPAHKVVRNRLSRRADYFGLPKIQLQESRAAVQLHCHELGNG